MSHVASRDSWKYSIRISLHTVLMCLLHDVELTRKSHLIYSSALKQIVHSWKQTSTAWLLRLFVLGLAFGKFGHHTLNQPLIWARTLPIEKLLAVYFKRDWLKIRVQFLTV